MDNDYRMLKEYVGKRLADVIAKLDDDGCVELSSIAYLKGQERAYSDILGMANRMDGLEEC